ARVRSSRCGPEPRAPQDRADRRRRDSDAELAELSLDPDAPPSAVLPSHPQDEGPNFRSDGRTACPPSPSIGPLPAYELAVPPEERLGPDQEEPPPVPRDGAACRGEHDPVDSAQAERSPLPTEHPDLVP